MRTLDELIEEMNDVALAENAFSCCIVVGFPNESKMVSKDDEDPLERLTQLCKKGGEPIGLLVGRRRSGTKS